MSEPATQDDYYEIRLENRGREKLAEHQLAESFEVTVKTINPTYSYGTDYKLGDKITVTDERLNLTTTATVSGVINSIVNGILQQQLELGFERPTMAKVLSRKGDK